MGTVDYSLALKAVLEASEKHAEFTTDDVWPLLASTPMEPNVVGMAFHEANRRGWIVGTERFVRSRRRESKGRRVQVWRRAPRPEGTLFDA